MAITEKRLKLKIRSDMMAGIRQFNLITTGDHILIGLSGGKDSLALLDFLGDAKNRAGSKFKISAAHIRMEKSITQPIQNTLKKSHASRHSFIYTYWEI